MRYQPGAPKDPLRAEQPDQSTSPDDGGSVIPVAVADEIFREAQRPGFTVYWGHPKVLPKLTRKQRFELAIQLSKWRVHDWLFPECRRDDW